MKLVFATNNKNKIKEIKALIGNSIELLSLGEINCHEDIPETSDTIEGNALQKAKYVHKNLFFMFPNFFFSLIKLTAHKCLHRNLLFMF